MDHLRRGLALGSGPDEKVALRLYVSTRPQCKATLRQRLAPVRGGSAGARVSAGRGEICGGGDVRVVGCGLFWGGYEKSDLGA